jgi:hypothetical protein
MPNKPAKAPGRLPPARVSTIAVRPVLQLGGDGKPLGVLASDGVGFKPGGELIPTVVPSVILAPLRAPDGLAGRPRALALIEELHQIKARVGAEAYRVGVILRELAAPEMVAALGCATFNDVLEEHRIATRISAFRSMAIAEAYTEDEAAELGVEKGYALIRYAKAMGDKTAPAMILRNDVKVGGTLVRDHTAASLTDVIVRARTRMREREEAESDTAQDANRAVRKLGPKLRSHGAPTAKLQQRRKGSRYVVRIELDPDEAMALWEQVFGPSSR